MEKEAKLDESYSHVRELLDQQAYVAEVEELMGDKLASHDLPILQEGLGRKFAPITTAHRIIAQRYAAPT